MDESEKDFEVSRPYKEFPYFNSNKEPFGLTLKGKTKEYVKAHVAVKALISKGKEICTPKGNLKFLDSTSNNAMVNAVIEIESDKKVKGNAELKAYDPSKKKSKGATIELRKTSDHEYSHVEDLKKILEFLLNKVLDGEEIEIFRKGARNDIKVNSTHVYECDLCSWKTKFKSALKTHQTRIHEKSTAYNTMLSDKVKDSRKRPKDNLACTTCDLLFHDEKELSNHITSLHTDKSLSSPPRKRMSPDNTELEKDGKIKDLEKVIKDLTDKKETNESQINSLKTQLKALNTLEPSLISKKVSQVKKEHIAKLRGHKSFYQTIADGRCLQNSLAVHAYNDEQEAYNTRNMLNEHIVQNYSYYKTHISFPFHEKVGVGKHSKYVTIQNDEEMIEFLKSDDAQFVYSNMHDIHAIANVFNIHMHIFTYEGDTGFWSYFSPDLEMNEHSLFFEKPLRDMYLYHSKNCHFDLLVLESETKTDFESNEIDGVELRRRKHAMEDHVVLNDVSYNAINKMIHNVEQPSQDQFTCKKCDTLFETLELMTVHMTLHDAELSSTCDDCKLCFKTRSDLDIHIESSHRSSRTGWNCNDCDFQGDTALQLMKHLKIKSHNPCSSIEKKKLFNDHRKCYTCDLEVDGY